MFILPPVSGWQISASPGIDVGNPRSRSTQSTSIPRNAVADHWLELILQNVKNGISCKCCCTVGIRDDT